MTDIEYDLRKDVEMAIRLEAEWLLDDLKSRRGSKLKNKTWNDLSEEQRKILFDIARHFRNVRMANGGFG